MSKKFFVKLLSILIVAFAAVLWLLSELVPAFDFFNLAWAGVLLAGGYGTLFILEAVFEKNPIPLKKIKIWVGIALEIVAFSCLLSAIIIPDNIVLPIIALILVAGLLITLIASGGKNWDTADNQKVGYKNYFERKKEENKQK